jgi:hypothetical protein
MGDGAPPSFRARRGGYRHLWRHWHAQAECMGWEGLRVAEASVMPDVMRANTKATTMMMPERVPIASAQRRKT